MISFRILRYAILLAGVAFMLRAPAMLAAEDSDYDDPPDQIARMNYAQGSVSFQPGNEGEWVAASTNRPLTVGDNLWADQGSRAELHIGSTALRLSSESSLSFLDLRDRAIQMRLSAGTLFLHVPRMDQGDVIEVDTPNTAFSELQPGDYRVDVNHDGNETLATVWHGQGEAVGGGYSYTVAAGQQGRFLGTDQLSYQIGSVTGSDDFDNWAFDRDRSEHNIDAVRYVSPEVTGYEDLDQYGRWDNVSEYGPVWTPSLVPVGWSPYSTGHWVWIQPWGWTWVDDQPWGFAPFHYGRWAMVSNRWGWIPGPIHERPVYAPALVAFVGGPQGFQTGGGPGVGWFPLGPGEVFVPGYRVTPRYVTRVNVTNTVVQVTRVTTVYNYYNTNNRRQIETVTYVNRRAPNGVTVVSRDTFVNARPVNSNVVRVSADQIAKAQVESEVALQPVKASVMGPNAVAKARPPAAIAERPVIAKRTPPPTLRPTNQVASGATNQPNQPTRNPLVKAAPAVREKNPPQQQAHNQPSNARPQPNTNGNENRAARPQTPQPNPQPERRNDMTQPVPKPQPEPKPAPQPDRRAEPAQPRPENPQVDRRQAEPAPRQAVPQPERPNQTPQPHPETPEVNHRQAEPRREVPPAEPRKEVMPPSPSREVPRPEPGKEPPATEQRKESPDALRPAPRPEPGKEAPKAEPRKQPPQEEKPKPPSQS
jgi:hypothetical protein